MSKEFTCIVCPLDCLIKVDDQNQINGYSCIRGLEYAKNEIFAPKRMLSTTIRTDNKDVPVISVKTDGAIPKEFIFDVLKIIKSFVLTHSVEVGDILIENVLNTGVNVVSTKSLKHKK